MREYFFKINANLFRGRLSNFNFSQAQIENRENDYQRWSFLINLEYSPNIPIVSKNIIVAFLNAPVILSHKQHGECSQRDARRDDMRHRWHGNRSPRPGIGLCHMTYNGSLGRSRDTKKGYQVQGSHLIPGFILKMNIYGPSYYLFLLPLFWGEDLDYIFNLYLYCIYL